MPEVDGVLTLLGGQKQVGDIFVGEHAATNTDIRDLVVEVVGGVVLPAIVCPNAKSIQVQGQLDTQALLARRLAVYIEQNLSVAPSVANEYHIIPLSVGQRRGMG